MFIVMCNMPGCLPEMDPVVVEELGEGKRLVVEELEARMDEMDCEVDGEGEVEEEMDEQSEDFRRAIQWAQTAEGPFVVLVILQGPPYLNESPVS